MECFACDHLWCACARCTIQGVLANTMLAHFILCVMQNISFLCVYPAKKNKQEMHA